MSNTYDKQLYVNFPKYMRVKLDLLIETYGEEPWFENAWKEFMDFARFCIDVNRYPDVDWFFEEAKKNEIVAKDETGEKFSDEEKGISFSEIFGEKGLF